MNNSILITGATGFVGKNLKQYLFKNFEIKTYCKSGAQEKFPKTKAPEDKPQEKFPKTKPRRQATRKISFEI